MIAKLLLVFGMAVGISAPPLPGTKTDEADTRRCADGNIPVGTAIRACTRLIESGRYNDADRAAWLTNRALHHSRAGQLAEAIPDFDGAIRLVPGNIELYLARGAAYGMSKSYDLALADFDRALKIDSQSGYAYMNRAKALESKGDLDASLRDYDLAIALLPKEWIAWDGRCWVRAIIGEDLEGALSDCEEALKLHPEAFNTMNSLGFVFFRKKRYTDAITWYDASIVGAPDIASSYYMRGLARQALGQEALGDFEKSDALEPGIRERYAGYGIAPP